MELEISLVKLAKDFCSSLHELNDPLCVVHYGTRRHDKWKCFRLENHMTLNQLDYFKDLCFPHLCDDANTMSYLSSLPHRDVVRIK